MNKKTDSVAKGGTSVAIARISGMAFSFVLFLLLARHSTDYAAIFRTTMTYIIIAEFLGMFGMHRWLATEIAPENSQRWQLFLATNAFTLCVTTLMTIIYCAIAATDFYAEDFRTGIYLGALAVIPSGIYACVQTAFIGIGRSHLMGKLNMMENVIRCSASIVLVLLNRPVTEIIMVFVFTRWFAALYGFVDLKNMFNQTDTKVEWQVRFATLGQLAKHSPKFGLSMLAFLLLRNIGMLLLPAFTNAYETALFAVCYQLFDLILVVPSVLAITSTNQFANKANASKAALKKASIQLVTLSALAIFPMIAITAGFSHQLLVMIYGEKYFNGGWTLIILMLAAALMIVDQVLSQVMLANKSYRQDMIAMMTGAVGTVILSLILISFAGAKAAGIALMLGILITIIARLMQMNGAFSLKLLSLGAWKPTAASFLVFLLVFFGLQQDYLSQLSHAKFLWLLLVPVAIVLYIAGLFLLGCFKKSHFFRMRLFLFHH
jgi:O-antigen/teichoic acid export membrane protein